MYKKQKPKKKKDMELEDLKFSIVPNRLEKCERYLKIRTNETMRKKVSTPVEMTGIPIIKAICRTNDNSIKTVIMAYEAASANVLPFMRNKKKAAVIMQKICAKSAAVINTLFSLSFPLLFL